MAQILDGKKLAEKIKAEVAADVARFVERTGVTPGLATVLVGENPASKVYVGSKIKTTQACGMRSFHHDLPAETTPSELMSFIDQLNADKNVHGILVQLPLPNYAPADAVIARIAPQKDVDGFHRLNAGALALDQPGLKPCTPNGVMRLFKEYKIDVAGKDVLVIGRSNIVGKPMSALLLNAGATVTVAHSLTKNLPEKARLADIIVAAAGAPKLVKADWVKDGAVVVDVGINRLPDGKLCGDVDFEAVAPKTSYVTPVPGGVGPMTIAMLMANTLQAAQMQLE